MSNTISHSNTSVYIRKPDTHDKSALQAAYARSKELHYPFTFVPTDLDAYIANENRYLVCKKEDHAIVGAFNISNIVRGWFQSAYLGYEVFVPYQQQGLMHQGMALVMEEAFTKLNLHRLEANIQPDNLASIKLVTKSGFIKEGFSKHYLRIGSTEWKDHERWAIVNENWKDVEAAN
jgi:[ribosomal protein S5]-alanine N-acetyltransferase